jgi:hypothetical protein
MQSNLSLEIPAVPLSVYEGFGYDPNNLPNVFEERNNFVNCLKNIEQSYLAISSASNDNGMNNEDFHQSIKYIKEELCMMILSPWTYGLDLIIPLSIAWEPRYEDIMDHFYHHPEMNNAVKGLVINFYHDFCKFMNWLDVNLIANNEFMSDMVDNYCSFLRRILVV